jgi:hypothetical protein
MKQWEYLVVRLDIHHHTYPGVHTAVVSTPNGVPQEVDPACYLSQLGAGGWELAGALGYGSNMVSGMLIFKRPLAA